MGEYVFSKQGVKRENDETGAVTRVDHDNSGSFAQVSYVLTGEHASYKGVSPINKFDPRNGRWGAFEVAARGSHVKIDDDAFDFGLASEPTSTAGAWNWGVGVNWYLNRNFRFNLNYERTEFDTPVSFGGALREHEAVVLTRFQASY
jgi:phosphate-selective porin OprO/OprP